MKNPPKDTHLWHDLIKGIQPLKNRPQRVEPPVFEIQTDRIEKNRLTEYFESHTQTLSKTLTAQERAKKLHKIGKVIIEARLDLHGLTRNLAHHRLQHFIAMAYYDRLKWVLIITGKGHPDNPQTLKKLLPDWLEQMPLVTGYAVAKDAHGGEGAHYVRLKTNQV